jgi:ribosome biogenesis GTPase / thiamine phosphate phosphatase
MDQFKRKPGRKVRVAMRKNRNVRERNPDLIQYLRDPEANETEITPQESIRPRGAMSRHRTVDTSRLHWYELEIPPDSRELSGVVLRMFGAYAEVGSDQGPALCSLRRILRTVQTAERGAVAVGDRVTFRLAKPAGPAIPADLSAELAPPVKIDLARLPQGVIERVLPRGGELCRCAKGRWHTLAANVDQLLIVTSCAMPPVSTHLLDRYLVTAEVGALRPVIILNKIDLEAEPDPVAGALARLHEIYDPLHVLIHPASVVTGEGVDEFRRLLAGKRSAIAGQSGVGKSSLLNSAYPGLKLAIQKVSEFWQHGRHTTSAAVLIPLPGGLQEGFVVDTPGVRQLGLWELSARDIAAYFPDLTQPAAACRFNDCTHRTEEGCAVRTAVEKGTIHPSRYESYLRMIEESQK